MVYRAGTWCVEHKAYWWCCATLWNSGDVLLLTNPMSSGYIQNPISVYYCYDDRGVLEMCIAEVTNTPWGERVTFLFDPKGQTVPKALHVSPMMDMKNIWWAVFLFSKLNTMVFGYFDPEKIVLDNEINYFLGWPNWYFDWKRTTDGESTTSEVLSFRRWIGYDTRLFIHTLWKFYVLDQSIWLWKQ